MAFQCALWECQCQCGVVVIRRSQYLRASHRIHPRSCGCHHGNDTHKMTFTRPYNIWSGMKRRCINVKDKDFRNYGARGITVCDQWVNSFEQFWLDMQSSYQDGLTIDRIDTNKGYSPQNCRWATAREQGNNTRNSHYIDTPLGVMTIANAARAYGLKKATLHARITRYKWGVEKALTTPAKQFMTF